MGSDKSSKWPPPYVSDQHNYKSIKLTFRHYFERPRQDITDQFITTYQLIRCGLNIKVSPSISRMQNGGAIPERREVLGDHLYSLVVGLNVAPDEAGQVTGMLLEMGNDEVLKMLQNKHLLQVKVKEAKGALKRRSDCSGFDNEELAEKLYQRIEDQEQDNCAKLTGMLLELDCTMIEKLLSSNKDLDSAIGKAKACLDNSENRSSAVDREKERIGEELFDEVSEIYPDFAAKITGMMLEMDLGSLKVLLNCPQLLKQKVEIAYKALMNAPS